MSAQIACSCPSSSAWISDGEQRRWNLTSAVRVQHCFIWRLNTDLRLSLVEHVRRRLLQVLLLYLGRVINVDAVGGAVRQVGVVDGASHSFQLRKGVPHLRILKYWRDGPQERSLKVLSDNSSAEKFCQKQRQTTNRSKVRGHLESKISSSQSYHWNYRLILILLLINHTLKSVVWQRSHQLNLSEGIFLDRQRRGRRQKIK